MNNNETKNTIIFLSLATVILIGWNVIFPSPEPKKNITNENTVTLNSNDNSGDFLSSHDKNNDVKIIKSVENVLDKDDRIKINTPSLSGSISLTGGVIDSLVLKKYRKELDENSENIRLLSPLKTQNPYFTETGWIGTEAAIPSRASKWQTDSKELKVGSPVVLTWTSNSGVEFRKIISVDENYLFKIKQEVVNKSTDPIKVADYGLINRNSSSGELKSIYILHEGPIGVFDNILQEIDYSDLDDENETFSSKNGWLGFTDKYWLVSLVPNEGINANSGFRKLNNSSLYQADFSSEPVILDSGEKRNYEIKIFAGAKDVGTLSKYVEEENIPMLDDAVDWGWFYFLTKPFYKILHFLGELVGNVGFGIILMTILIRIIMYPLAVKSYTSLAKTKMLAPKVNLLRERHKGDKMSLNKEMMELYKKEKVNPAAGCLPMLIQIPIFFSLYKVLFVTLEMRHADFILWINDLSAPDDNRIFELFGLISWDVPGILAMFNIGIWPILMGVSMWAQQKFNPTPQDPIQARIFFWLPIIFTFVLASFPSGLVIYWTFNNVISIIQQLIIKRKIEKKYG